MNVSARNSALHTLLRGLAIAVALIATTATITRSTAAWADERADAKAHYQSGTKLYAAGSYQDAVKEFQAAEQLVPSGYNDYNLALCYDKLGDAGSAIQYYNSYLKRVPDAANKATVEASVSRLDAAKKSADVKKDAEAKKLAAKSASDAKAAKAAEDAKEAADAKSALDNAKPGLEPQAKHGVAEQAPVVPSHDEPAVVGGGSTGTPGTGETVTTGDAQLDRVAAIDINGIRDQQGGMLGMRDGAANVGPNGPSPSAPNGPMAGVQGPGVPGGPAEPNKSSGHFYTKWYFWVMVAVAGFFVYEIATANSSSNNNEARLQPLDKSARAAEGAPHGLTLLSW